MKETIIFSKILIFGCVITLQRNAFVNTKSPRATCRELNFRSCGTIQTRKGNIKKENLEGGATCLWDIRNEKCRENDGSMVNCGAHGAFTCGECIVGNSGKRYGENTCGGDCAWSFQKSACIKKYAGSKHPNIIFVLADDLGYTDVQYANASTITPNIMKFAKEGILLNQNYMQSTCAPSRTALMTGMYPFHIGKQDWNTLKAMIPTGLSLDRTILPSKLRKLGYDTHLVGKWDLGFCNEAYTPTRRGFDSFFGYWGQEEDHYTKELYGVKDWKSDLDNAEINPDEYQTYPMMERVMSIINQSSIPTERNPLFLLLASPLPHDPWQVPQKYYDLHSNIKDEDQRTRNGMVTLLDETIGKLMEMIKHAGMYENTVLIFSSDNGPCKEIEFNLHDTLGQFKGSKTNDIFEGGTLVPGFINSPLLPEYHHGFESNALIHATDWYPTILRIAGMSPEEVDELLLDGIDQYDMLFTPVLPKHKNPRTNMVYNIKMENNIPVGAVRKGWWKYSESFQNESFVKLLFNLENDPTEKANLISVEKQKVKEMRNFFWTNVKSMVPADTQDACPCPNSEPNCSRKGLPTDCTGCLNVDENNCMQSGWCDIETESCK